MDYVVSDDDKEYIRTYVADAPDDDTKKERRKECAAVFNLSLPQVAAITAHTKIRANRAAQAEAQQAEAHEEAHEEAHDVAEVEILMPAGTAMDYDNPIKQKYRSVLKNFIVKHFPNVEERKGKKVLCLPGRKCLEVQTYIDLGFLPQNIVGVEHETTAFREFLHHASELGISVRTCDLDRVTDEEEWDLVNWDFCGPIKKKVLDLLGNLRLNPKAKCIFGMNLLGQRESDAAQQIIDQYYATVQAAKQIVDQPNFVAALEAQNEVQAGFRQRRAEGVRLTKEDVDIGEQRDAAIPMAVWHKIGKVHNPYNRVSPAPNLPEPFRNDEMVQLLINCFFRAFWRELHFQHNVPLDEAAAEGHKIMLMYEIAMAPRHICTDVEQYSYISPSRQKYLTDFYVMEFARPYGTSCDEIIAFVNNSLEGLSTVAFAPEEKHSWRFQSRHRNGSVSLTSSGLRNSDVLEFVVDEKVYGRLGIRAMFSGLDRVAKMLSRDMTLRTTHGTHKYERIAL